MIGIYFDKPSACRTLCYWLHSSWRLNEVSGGYERLGKYREVGTRWFGICTVWFATEADKKKYEEQN